jgi:hypothetical protein
VENWQKEVPYLIRDGALQELLQAFKVNFKKLRQGRIKKFRVKFRSKKDQSQSILIPKASFSRKYHGVFYEKTMGRAPIKSNVPIPRPENIGSPDYLRCLQAKWYGGSSTWLSPSFHRVIRVLGSVVSCRSTPSGLECWPTATPNKGFSIPRNSMLNGVGIRAEWISWKGLAPLTIHREVYRLCSPSQLKGREGSGILS